MRFLLILALGIAAQRFHRARPDFAFSESDKSLFMENAFDSLKGERPKRFGEKTEIQVEQKETHLVGDFDRSDMMVKLEAAEASIAEAISDSKRFKAATHKIDAGSDIIIMMGKTLFNGDPDYGEDDDYLKSAEDMTTSAKQLKQANQKGNHKATKEAFERIKKNCNACHDKFRL
jgi:cytochrome c556